MDKIAIQSALSTVFGGSAIASPDKFPCFNGSSLGYITPANLESVLGEVIKTIASGGSCNDAKANGIYQTQGCSDQPRQGWGYMRVYGNYNRVSGGNVYVKQEWFKDSVSTPYSYERYYFNGTWSSWSLVYTDKLLSNASELSSLASALGGGKIEVITSGDLNDLKQGTYQTNAELAHKPSGAGDAAIIFHTNWQEGFWNLQFYYDTTTSTLYHRRGTSTGYGNELWYAEYSSSILTNSSLLSSLASALGGTEVLPIILNETCANGQTVKIQSTVNALAAGLIATGMSFAPALSLACFVGYGEERSRNKVNVLVSHDGSQVSYSVSKTSNSIYVTNTNNENRSYSVYVLLFKSASTTISTVTTSDVESDFVLIE